MPKSATSHRKGLAKSHRVALSPTDRQATLMMEHAGWARVAANWARDEFRRAWFTGEGEPNEWLSDMDLRKRFNAVKREEFPWSRKSSQNVAKNAIIHMGRGLDEWGEYCQARKHGRPHRKTGFPPVRKCHRKLAFTPSNGRNSI